VGARVTAASTHLGMPAFPAAAREALQDTQLRNNLAHATATIRTKRLRAVAEVSNWQELREHAALVKDHTLRNLDRYLVQFEEAATAAGAVVHWAIDAGEANRIVIDLVRATGADEVVKVKSMATQEIDLNEALQDAGIAAWETDLAELIVQLGHDFPSHFLVPAIHRNRSEIREIFVREMGKVGRPAPDDLTDEPGPAGRGRPAAPATEVPPGQGRDLRCELRHRRDRDAGRRRERGQRTHVPDAAGDAHLRRRHRGNSCPASRISLPSCSCCRGPRPPSG